MRLTSAVLAFGLGACASLDMREDDRNFDLYCSNGEREEPLCRDIESRRAAGYATTPTPSRGGCCKTCSSSKACGNSCIAYGKACHQPPGCAC